MKPVFHIGQIVMFNGSPAMIVSNPAPGVVNLNIFTDQGLHVQHGIPMDELSDGSGVELEAEPQPVATDSPATPTPETEAQTEAQTEPVNETAAQKRKRLAAEAKAAKVN